MGVDSLVINVNVGRWFSGIQIMVTNTPPPQLAFRQLAPVDPGGAATRRVEYDAMALGEEPVHLCNNFRERLRLRVVALGIRADGTVDVEAVDHKDRSGPATAALVHYTPSFAPHNGPR